jgi:hypothetical protein
VVLEQADTKHLKRSHFVFNMNKRGVEMPFAWVIAILLLVVFLVVLLLLLNSWRGQGIGLLDYLSNLFRS